MKISSPNKPIYLSPAKLVILLFGGIRPVARIVNIAHSGVSNWQKSKDGGVPRSHHITLLNIAKKRGVLLTAEDLTFGRNIQKNVLAKTMVENKIDKRIKI